VPLPLLLLAFARKMGKAISFTTQSAHFSLPLYPRQIQTSFALSVPIPVPTNLIVLTPMPAHNPSTIKLVEIMDKQHAVIPGTPQSNVRLVRIIVV